MLGTGGPLGLPEGDGYDRRNSDGHPLRPGIYPQEWTAAHGRRHEIGGTLATLKRVLFRVRRALPWAAALL
jgi:hypothetical protein